MATHLTHLKQALSFVNIFSTMYNEKLHHFFRVAKILQPKKTPRTDRMD